MGTELKSQKGITKKQTHQDNLIYGTMKKGLKAIVPACLK